MKKVNIKDITEKLNKARTAAGNRVFKNNVEFGAYLESFGIKSKNSNLRHKFYKLLIDGKFPEYPIYINKVENIYAELRELRKTYNNSVKVVSENDIEKAITLLKEAGYKIMKPVVEYEEI